MACPPGWTLPNDVDFQNLTKWLDTNSKWSEWNNGFALAGHGYGGKYSAGQGFNGYWWSSGNSNRYYWKGDKDGFGTSYGSISYSVRCRKYQ
jgi:hypothetical protein